MKDIDKKERNVLYEELSDDQESEESKERSARRKKRKSRLLKIRISFVALIVISVVTYFYDTYLYNREAEKLEEMKKQSRIEKREETKPSEEEVKPEEKLEEKEETIPSEPEEPPYVSPIDFDYWWGINPDVIGYIHIPDTKIDYPILYDEKDNERYLHESIDGQITVHGSIYLDNLAKKDFTSRNNLIYGHNMRDGSMFKDVVKYKSFDYLKEHQTVYLYTPEREIKLRAIAAFYGDPDGKSRQTIFVDDSEFGQFVKSRLSLAPQMIELPDNDEGRVTQLFCLVTCSYEFNNARTFLYCINESDYEERIEEEQVQKEKKEDDPIENIVSSGLIMEDH